jgi:hypothetical protein
MRRVFFLSGRTLPQEGEWLAEARASIQRPIRTTCPSSEQAFVNLRGIPQRSVVLSDTRKVSLFLRAAAFHSMKR